MTLHLGNITFDCEDPPAQARFWSAALDRPVDPDPSPFFASIGASDGGTPKWLFVKVPEPKTAKNRCHVDLQVEARDGVQTEVDRLVALGATVIRPPKEEWGVYWATLQDPEGNEFCVGTH